MHYTESTIQHNNFVQVADLTGLTVLKTPCVGFVVNRKEVAFMHFTYKAVLVHRTIAVVKRYINHLTLVEKF
jgi:hypothetical protein